MLALLSLEDKNATMKKKLVEKGQLSLIVLRNKQIFALSSNKQADAKRECYYIVIKLKLLWIEYVAR